MLELHQAMLEPQVWVQGHLPSSDRSRLAQVHSIAGRVPAADQNPFFFFLENFGGAFKSNYGARLRKMKGILDYERRES